MQAANSTLPSRTRFHPENPSRVMLPPLNTHGFLPEGLHAGSLEDVRLTFGTDGSRRQWLFSMLQEIMCLATETAMLERAFVFGSFISAARFPNDLDALLVMSADFTPEALPPDSRALFDYTTARTRFNSDVFWTRSSVGAETLELLLDTYQNTRDFTRRGIVELQLP